MRTDHRAVSALLFLLALAVSATSFGATRREKTSNRITIATYNLQHMVDSYDDPHTFDEKIPAKQKRAIKEIARAIRHLDADVVALQEVENEAFLRTMIEQHLDDMGYRQILVEQTNSRYGLNLGVISRKPIVSVTSHRFLELPVPKHISRRRFARDFLHVRLQVNSKEQLDLFVVHLKSRYDSADDPHSRHWRRAEATAALGIIRQTLNQNPGSGWILVAGDLNATPHSQTLELLLKGHGGKRPFLVDLHDHLPGSQRLTYLRKPHRGTIDYLLATPSFAKRAVAKSARVLSYQSLSAGSDHAPVVVTFDIGPSP